MSRVLIVSSHPDDETLGCGGTLLKHNYDEDEVYWLIMTSLLKEKGYKKEQITKRDNEIKQVATKYNMDDVFKLR